MVKKDYEDLFLNQDFLNFLKSLPENEKQKIIDNVNERHKKLNKKDK